MSDETHTAHSGNGAIDWSAEVAAHRRWLRTVVYSRVGDAHAVEEVLQDVALSAVEGRPALSDASQARAWLYRVAVRQSLLYRRRIGREKRRTNHFAQRQRAASESAAYDPLRWVLADEERELVRRALAELRPGDRELLLLKYTEDWTCRELAGHLGIRVTTVETRLHRARQRLRQALARMDITEDHQ